MALQKEGTGARKIGGGTFYCAKFFCPKIK